MMRLLGQMMKLPVAIFVYGMEMLVKTMQGMQKLADQGVDAMLQGIPPQSEMNKEAGCAQSQFSGSMMSVNEGARHRGAKTINHITHMEVSKMSDQDLRGDDLKLVRYVVLFTRRDLEVAFPEKTELVTYSTTLGDYQGAKKAEFLRQIDADPIPRPQRWIDNDYPESKYRDTDGKKFRDLPKDDIDEFLKVNVQILERYDKEESAYDKDQVKELKGIKEALKDTIKVRQV